MIAYSLDSKTLFTVIWSSKHSIDYEIILFWRKDGFCYILTEVVDELKISPPNQIDVKYKIDII